MHNWQIIIYVYKPFQSRHETTTSLPSRTQRQVKLKSEALVKGSDGETENNSL